MAHIHLLISMCVCVIVRVLLCVSCVPASCVHIWFVSCPCFMSLWVKYVPAVFVSLSVNYTVYISPVFWVWFRLVYLWLPGVSCLSALSCPALMFIKYYYLSLRPRLHVLVPPLGAPFAGDHATGSPLTQCPPACLWLDTRRPASDSMPAGSPQKKCTSKTVATMMGT